jgi:hypothetical protein
MKKLVLLAAFFVFATSVIGCRAEAEIEDSTSIALPR